MDSNCPFQLPTFNGITIDKRLRQLRKVTSKGIEFIEFDSDKGQKLLSEMSDYFSFLLNEI